MKTRIKKEDDDVGTKARLVVLVNINKLLDGAGRAAVVAGLGVNKATVSRWSTGRVTPDIATLAKIAAWAGVPFYSFVREIDTWRK